MAVEWNQTVTTSMTLVVALITVGFIITIARVGTGMLLAYYILRVRAGESRKSDREELLWCALSVCFCVG